MRSCELLEQHEKVFADMQDIRLESISTAARRMGRRENPKLYYTVKYTCAKHLATLKSFDFMVVWSLDLSPHHHGLIQKLYILTQPSYTMYAMIT